MTVMTKEELEIEMNKAFTRGAICGMGILTFVGFVVGVIITKL